MDVYCRQVAAAVDAQDGSGLAVLLNTTQRGAMTDVAAAVNVGTVDHVASSILPDGFDVLAAQHLKVLAAMQRGKPIQGWHAQLTLVETFVSLLEDSSDNWLLQPLYVVSLDARLLAYKAETAVKESGVGLPEKALRDLVEQLKKAFSLTFNHRQPDPSLSRRRGALFMATQLFRLYFRLTNIRASQTLIDVLARKPPDMATVPLPHRVTFNYYKGRLLMFQDRFAEANDALTYALDHCSPFPSATRNKRRIMRSLVPVRMHLGVLPTPGLLAEYKLQAFAPLADAIRTGNVKLWAQGMSSYRKYFIQCGMFLLLQKLEPLVHRALFKRTCAFVGGTKIPLKTLHHALVWAGHDVDMDELECILANLKFKGLLKGFIAHSVGLLVTGSNPFPSVASVASKLSAEAPALG